MEKKVNRFFGASTEIQAKWLNRMASEGWRLIRTGKMSYEFESCDPGKVQYAVEFIADKSQKNAEDYNAGCNSDYCTLYRRKAESVCEYMHKKSHASPENACK